MSFSCRIKKKTSLLLKLDCYINVCYAQRFTFGIASPYEAVPEDQAS